MKTVQTTSGKLGNDLDQVLRDVLGRVASERGWSDKRLAEELDIPPSSFHRFWKQGQSLKMSHFSRICAALEMNPVALLASHEAYSHEARAFMRFGKDALYDRFRTLLSTAEARELIKNIEAEKELGIYDLAAQATKALREAAQRAHRKGARTRTA